MFFFYYLFTVSEMLDVKMPGLLKEKAADAV